MKIKMNVCCSRISDPEEEGKVSRKKKTWILAGMCCMAVILSGCSEQKKTAETQPRSIKIGVSVYDQYDTFMSEIISQLQSYVREKEKDWGISITLDIQNADHSQFTQNDQMEAFIEEGCDLACINLVDRTDASIIIEKAKNNNVPVIFFNRELVEEDLERWDRLYYVGADAFESGRLQGEILVEQCDQDFASIDRNGDGILQYIMLEGEAGHNDSMVRSMSVINEITESGYTVEKLADEIANWNRDQASNKMTPFLNSYGVEIEVILANNDDMALGAADALKARGMDSQSDNWPVILGVDGTEVGMKAVEKGELLGTVLNDARGQARGMLELAGSVILKRDLSSEYVLQDGKYIRLPYQKVTAENVSKIQSRQSE